MKRDYLLEKEIRNIKDGVKYIKKIQRETAEEISELITEEYIEMREHCSATHVNAFRICVQTKIKKRYLK